MLRKNEISIYIYNPIFTYLLTYKIVLFSCVFRYSQPETAVTAFAAMKSEVCSENFHYWLSALHSIASAEHILSDNKTIPRLIPRINQASNLYLQGVATVKVVSH